MTYETERWAQRRRGLDQLERTIVRLHLKRPDEVPIKLLDGLRYVVSFARLTQVRNKAGQDVDVDGLLHRHAMQVEEQLGAMLEGADSLWDAVRGLPKLVQHTRTARAGLLDHLPIDRDSLESEVTTRQLVLACGGGGGAGFAYLGAHTMLDRAGLRPDLLVGTSMGALTNLFRGRTRHYDLAVAVEAARRLSWTDVFRVLETENRYGLPATLRMYLQAALGSLFVTPDGRDLWLSDMQIPTYIMTTGLTLDALKHDLGYYEHFLDGDLRRGSRRALGVRSIVRAASLIRELWNEPEALVQLVLGRDEGTKDFNAVDAFGFSASIPGALHYDVLRDDPRMHALLDGLYARYGIARLGEGGILHNVPARVAWESSIAGELGVRQPFVLALDCFAPNPRRPAWFALQQAVRTANVNADREFADLYVAHRRTLSPINVVPTVHQAIKAMKWGRDEMTPHMPFIVEMMRPISVLREA